MKNHVFQHDFGGIGHAEGDHGEGVTNKDKIHAGCGCEGGGGEVVGCQHGDGDIFAVEVSDGMDCDWFCTDGQSRLGGSGSVRAVTGLVASRGEGRERCKQRLISYEPSIIEDELSNPRTQCSGSHDCSAGRVGKTIKEKVETVCLSLRILIRHPSQP